MSVLLFNRSWFFPAKTEFGWIPPRSYRIEAMPERPFIMVPKNVRPFLLEALAPTEVRTSEDLQSAHEGWQEQARRQREAAPRHEALAARPDDFDEE